MSLWLVWDHNFDREGSMGGIMSNTIIRQVGTKSGRIFFRYQLVFITGGQMDDTLRIMKSQNQIYDDEK